MPVQYDRHSLKLTWGGTAGGSSGDIWQCGVHLTLTGDVPVEDPGPPFWSVGDLNELWVAVLAPWMSGATSYISHGAVLRWVKLAALGSDAKYIGEPIFINPGPTPGAATGFSGASPQDAMVYTMWSGESLGKGNYGRIYAPWCTAPVSDVTGCLDPGTQGPLLTAAVNLLGGIQTYARDLSPDTMLAIMHMETALGPASTKPVTEIKIGAVKDTQRRRRSALSEAYASAPLL